jgi:hypothetical protein
VTVVSPARPVLLSTVLAIVPLIVLAGQASADPASVVRVDCPDLDAATQALLEARTRAEIAAASRSAVEWTIRCGLQTVTVTVRASRAPPREQSVDLRSEADVDAVLEAIHDLSTAEPDAAPAPAPRPEAGAPRPAIASDVAAEPPKPKPALAPAPSDQRARVAAVASVDAELWSGRVAGAVGASAGARVQIGRWITTGLVEPERGIQSAEGLTAWGLRGMLRVDGAPTDSVRFGLGLTGRIVWASSDALASSGPPGTTAGIVANARFALRIGALELTFGPWVEAVVRPVVITVDGGEVFRVPTFISGLSIEAAFPAE